MADVVLIFDMASIIFEKLEKAALLIFSFITSVVDGQILTLLGLPEGTTYIDLAFGTALVIALVWAIVKFATPL